MIDETATTVCDLAKHRKTALSRRECAWQLLKQTRNPEYVAARYGYSVAKMRRALENIPDEKTIQLTRRARIVSDNSAANVHTTVESESGLLSPIAPCEKIPVENADKI